MVSGVGVLDFTIYGEAEFSPIRVRLHRARGDVIPLVYPTQFGDVPRDATPRWSLALS